MPEATTNWFDNRDDCRTAESIANRAWFAAYCALPAPGAIQRGVKPDPEALEAVRVAKSVLDKIQAEGIAKWGDNKAHPDCQQCLLYSVFGGPGHDASPRCRSGRRPHCSCDTCW